MISLLLLRRWWCAWLCHANSAAAAGFVYDRRAGGQDHPTVILPPTLIHLDETTKRSCDAVNNRRFRCTLLLPKIKWNLDRSRRRKQPPLLFLFSSSSSLSSSASDSNADDTLRQRGEDKGEGDLSNNSEADIGMQENGANSNSKMKYNSDGDDLDDSIPVIDVRVHGPNDDDANRKDDLSDRFKYKVQALMGAFDPYDASSDNEKVNGNIFNAMLQFPVVHTFHVVGKTKTDNIPAGIIRDDDYNNTINLQQEQDDFVEAVQAIVLQETGESKSEITTRVTPRGSKFTKVSVSVQVQSSQMISAIYKQLEAMELSVMQF
ncbi:hypothetical protein ACA910_000505 [Epithemia clementina (nom. ined.)]